MFLLASDCIEAFDLFSSKKLWTQTDIPKQCNTLLADRHRIYCIASSSCIALEATNGNVMWKAGDDIVDAYLLNSELVLLSQTGIVSFYDKLNGELTHSIQPPSKARRPQTYSSVVSVGNRLYWSVPFSSGISLHVADTDTHSLIHSVQSNAPLVGPLVFDENGIIYAVLSSKTESVTAFRVDERKPQPTTIWTKIVNLCYEPPKLIYHNHVLWILVCSEQRILGLDSTNGETLYDIKITEDGTDWNYVVSNCTCSFLIR